MRKGQKQFALEIVESLYEIHDALENAQKNGKMELALDSLRECQQAAICLGTVIEASEGTSGVFAVSLLEAYCEKIYAAYEAIGQDKSIREIQKDIKKRLVQIKNTIKQNLPTRLEVVFLPYKASMWDSLESIWKAAAEDTDCDARVIPIPYYDKNPDGSFREMHYEGGEYPDYVPVINYREYDFAERRPDIIFIHNPYDQYNYVTSVEPFFYSENLKKYTDKLVYIPYFILDEISPEDQTAVESMRHFCETPGVLNADRVIVQSEDMRQIYINVLLESAGGGEERRKDWEKKILGVGSPKADKVFNTRKEDLVIPEEWQRIILKPDGNLKKIILYNTSVSALLRHNEQMLVKIRKVLRIFEENQDEIALLWRPHPLIRATIASMRPKLWEEYKKIVARYQDEGWGIYDNTPEVDRAVCLCDGYYGDASSVVQLCQMAGKPALLQTVE